MKKDGKKYNTNDMEKDIKILAKKVLDLQPNERLYVRCADKETCVITYIEVIDSFMYVFSHLGATSTSVLLDEADEKEVRTWLDACTGGEYEILDCMSGICNLMTEGWRVTDASCGQYCKKVSDFSWLYFENDKGSADYPVLINIKEYTIDYIENVINSYGYTLNPRAEDPGLGFICDLYDDDYLQIIAECIFETKTV